MMFARTFTRIFVLLLFVGCDKSDPFIPVYDVAEDFSGIVQTFIQEGKNRGKEIAIKNLILKIDQNLDVPICGNCNSNDIRAEIQKIISINKSPCWLGPEEKEALTFHELGHCILGRVHTSELLPNGDPKSLMFQNNFGLYAPCDYVVDPEVNCNNLFKRDYYLNELFDETTPVPDWAK